MRKKFLILNAQTALNTLLGQNKTSMLCYIIIFIKRKYVQSVLGTEYWTTAKGWVFFLGDRNWKQKCRPQLKKSQSFLQKQTEEGKEIVWERTKKGYHFPKRRIFRMEPMQQKTKGSASTWKVRRWLHLLQGNFSHLNPAMGACAR